MGRALRVSKTLPIICCNRAFPSGEKFHALPSSADGSCYSLPHSNGDLPQHHHSPNPLQQRMGSLPLLAGRRLSLSTEEIRVRFGVGSSSKIGVFARFCSSETGPETEWSESEWPETDDEQPQHRKSEAFETEEESEGEAGPDSESGKRYGKGLGKKYGKGSGKEYGGDGGSDRGFIRDSDSDSVEVESDLEGELQAEMERQMEAEPKVTRPSITWGILLTQEHRRTTREIVIEYLNSEGINTSELMCIELPTSVDVMQTRLGFLRKLGLDNDSINNYPLVLGCSVQKNMVPVLKYLKKIGILQHCVAGLLRKYPMILHASVVIDILPVIYFLRGLDIDSMDIPTVLTRYPDVLGFKTEGTMSTSVAYLVSMGVKMRHVGRMLTEYPEILGMRVACVIKPKVEYLMSLGIPQLIVARILERRPQILGYDLDHRMQYNVSQLLEVGVQQEAIPGMVAQFPELLGRVFSPTLGAHVDWLKESLELDSDGVARIIEKMPQVIFLKEEVAMGRIKFLKSQRFTAKEIGVMATRCPQILVSSLDESLKPNITFLTREMKRTRQEVTEFPACLTYGLETRIRPRFKALRERDAKCSLEWLLNCSDGKFQRRLQAGYAGDEDAGHAFVMGGLLPGRSEKDEDEWQPSEQARDEHRFAFS